MIPKNLSDLTHEQIKLRNDLVGQVYDEWVSERIDNPNIIRVDNGYSNYDADLDEIATASPGDEADLTIRKLKAWKEAGVLLEMDDAPDDL